MSLPNLSDAERQLADHLTRLGCGIFTLPPDGTFPRGWERTDPATNERTLDAFRRGRALGVVLAGSVAVIDVDTKLGAEVEDTRHALADAGCPVFAEVATPSGGRHFYVAGGPSVLTVAQGKLTLPGVEVLARTSTGAGRFAFLPGSTRTKYRGKGYAVVFDRLDQLPAEGVPELEERTARFIAAHTVTEAPRTPTAPPVAAYTSGGTAYARSALAGALDDLGRAANGTRNRTLNEKALWLGKLIAGGQLDEGLTRQELARVAVGIGLTEREAHATITSGFTAGARDPRHPDRDRAGAFPVPDSRGGERGTPPGTVPGTFPERPEQAFPVPDPPCGERGTPEPGLFFDVAGLLDGGLPDPPEPEFGRRDDGACLFYAGQVNVVFGDPESGKTWIALAAAVDALRDGGRVLLLDFDHNGPAPTVERLLSLGARPDWLRSLDRFRYVEPDDAEHLRRIVRAAVEWSPDVAVVDSVGELLPALGLSSNSPDDWTLGHTRVLKPLAMAGACVIAIDHLAKNADSRASGPTGTAAKRRAVGGVSLRVTIRDVFTPGRGGAAAVTINKDRHGGLRKHCPAPDGRGEPYAATFTLDSSGDVMRWALKAPTAGDHAPGQVSRADLAELAKLDPPPKSVRDVKDRLGWGTTRAADALRDWRTASGPGGEAGKAGNEYGQSQDDNPCRLHPDAPLPGCWSCDERATA